MPSSKPAAPTATPPASVKRPLRGAEPPLKPQPSQESHTDARQTRAREFMQAEHAREAELTKKGYCF